MENVALGVKVFQREDDLTRLLDSIPETQFEKVYIADDGKGNLAEKALSALDLDIQVTIIDLEFDAGNGYARREIVNELSEEYLLMVDADHTVPTNISTLYDQLTSNKELGGVAGSIVEPPNNRVWQSGKMLTEEDDGLIRTAAGDHDVTFDQGAPLVYFDFVPHAILLKQSCLESYSWDRNYTTSREHLDFFVGHWKQTDWEFAISPSVFFGHYPGGDFEYESHRYSRDKQQADNEYFLEKWDYEFVETRDPYWFNSDRSDVGEKIRELVASRDVKSILQSASAYAKSIIH